MEATRPFIFNNNPTGKPNRKEVNNKYNHLLRFKNQSQNLPLTDVLSWIKKIKQKIKPTTPTPKLTPGQNHQLGVNSSQRPPG